MFRWYQNAAVCYVHLVDVALNDDGTVPWNDLYKARWFTRGWTLQKLIAPREIFFLTAEWQVIGDKEDLLGVLSSITHIDEAVLRTGHLEDVSVARRMSWASQRHTSRVEDAAYSLLGIFNVSIPLIYGEGRKAFQRLQEAIMITTYDQSIFAWGRLVPSPTDLIDEDEYVGIKSIPWKLMEQRLKRLGIFAKSPAYFKDSGDISLVDHGYTHLHNRKNPPVMVNGGVLLDLVIWNRLASVAYWDNPDTTLPQDIELAVLLCRVGNTGSQLVALALQPWGEDYYSRTDELVLVDLVVSQELFTKWTHRRHVLPYRPYTLRNADILLRRWQSPVKAAFVYRPNTKSGPAWRQKHGDRVLRLKEDADGDEYETFLFKTSRHAGFSATLRRTSKSLNPLGPLSIGISLCQISGRTSFEDGSPKWTTLRGEPIFCPADSHVMQSPSDTWQLDLDGAHRVYARAERMSLDEGTGGEVDVVDIVVHSLAGGGLHR